jgi:hypothetical protein
MRHFPKKLELFFISMLIPTFQVKKEEEDSDFSIENADFD